MNMIRLLRVRVQAIEELNLLVESPDHQTWRVPKDAVLGDPAIGQDIFLGGLVATSGDDGKQVLARALLNELLNPQT